MTHAHIVVDKSADNSKPHSICFFVFFSPQYQRQSRDRAEGGAGGVPLTFFCKNKNNLTKIAEPKIAKIVNSKVTRVTGKDKRADN